MPQEIVIEGAIITWPKLFTPEQIDGAGDPKFQAKLILPANAPWDLLNACVNEATAAKFPNGAPAGLTLPWKDATNDGFPGQFFINAYSGAGDPPQVTDQAVQPLMDRSKIFSGCIVNAYVRFYGYPQQGGGIAVFYAMSVGGADGRSAGAWWRDCFETFAAWVRSRRRSPVRRSASISARAITRWIIRSTRPVGCRARRSRSGSSRS